MRIVGLIVAAVVTVGWLAPAQALEPAPLSIRELAGMLGKKPLPRLAKFEDVNTDDKFAPGIDVLSGDAKVRVGASILPVTLMLFVRDGKVGCVRVMQDSLSIDDGQIQAEYDAAVQALLDSAVKPKGEPGLGGSTSNWSFDQRGWVEVSKSYDSQGLYFYILAGDMEASFKEYWRGYNAQGSSFYMP